MNQMFWEFNWIDKNKHKCTDDNHIREVKMNIASRYAEKAIRENVGDGVDTKAVVAIVREHFEAVGRMAH